MTLPDERIRALVNAKQFLRDLLDPKQTPKVPRAIRKEAYRVLKHFPTILDINVYAKVEGLKQRVFIACYPKEDEEK